MTVIAAYIDTEGRTAIGCDTGISTDGYCATVPTKLVRVGLAIVGWCGAPLWGRYLRGAEGVTSPADLERLADGWHRWGKERGHGQTQEGMALQWGSMVAALPGSLWTLASDGSVLPTTTGYVAVGSGGPVAMGALAVARRLEMAAARAVKAALDAAVLHADGVFGRLDVQVLEQSG